MGIGQLAAKQLPYSRLTISDGLEDMVIFDIEQDNQGFLWLTTRTGINRFDGSRFKTYNQSNGLPHNLARDLLKAKDGRLWAATEAGLAWIEGTEFKSISQDQWPTEVSSRVVQEAPDGTIWLATYGMGIVQVDVSGEPKIIQVLDTQSGLLNNRIRSLLIDHEGTIWAGDAENVIRYRPSSSGLTLNNKVEVIPWQAKPSEIRTIYQHNDQSIWVGTRNGITYFNGKAFVPLQFGVDLSGETINTISSDANNHIWVGTRGSGAYEFDQQRQLISHQNMQNGLPDNSVNIIFEDQELNKWFGTYGAGLARLSTHDVVNWKAQKAMPNPNVYAITADQNHCIWVGTNGDGVSKICEDEITHMTTDDGLSHNKVLTVVIDNDNNPWFGTLQGITQVVDGEFIQINVEQGLAGAVVYHIILAADGSFWLGTNNGLNHYQQGVFKTYRKEDGLPGNRINRIFEGKDGMLWLASSNGLSKFDGNQFTNWTTKDGLAANFINDIYEDEDGLIWLATNNGLNTFDGVTFTTWTHADGLPHNNATAILPGKNGDVWIGTSRGVAIFNGENFTTITSREGLVFDLVNRGAGYHDSDGNQWFGTAEGISRFASTYQPGSSSSPPIQLLSVQNDNLELPAEEKPILKEQDTNLTFSYTGISFQRAPDINYRYRLNSNKGSEWRQTRLNELQINSLDAGDYTFEVTARIGDGAWNPEPAQFAFKVTPPYWRTPWFMLLIVAALIAAALYRSWLSRQHALNLERLVENRTKQLQEVNQGLDWMANHDSLTRLANRHQVHDVLSQLNVSQSAEPFGVIIIDIDFFKTINDQYGHGVGDVALQLFAAMLRKATNPKHIAARWGGEEFLVLCPKTKLSHLQQLASQILQQCRELKIPVQKDQITELKCSIGYVYLAKLDKDSELTNQFEKAIQLADKALYAAKHHGRDRICGYIINQAHNHTAINEFIADPKLAVKNLQMEIIFSA